MVQAEQPQQGLWLRLAGVASGKSIMDSGVSMIETDSESDLGYGHPVQVFFTVLNCARLVGRAPP